MAFIAIDARADVAESKKGKLTPAQHAQLNAWCLASKTGILDWGNRCESTAASYSVSGGSATVYFKKGFAVICGRLVECEEGSSVTVEAPSVGTVNGKIILRFNLSNSGAEEFEATTKTGALVQQDLNDNPTTGVYELELYSYTATPTTVTLSRSNTDYIPDIGGKLAQFITVLTGTGMTGTGNPPLQGYDQSKGTIEERLTSLGFKEGNILNVGGSVVGKIYRQCNYVIGKITSVLSISSSMGLSIAPLGTATLNDFKPKEDTFILSVQQSGAQAFIRIKTDGSIDSGNSISNNLWTMGATYPNSFGYEANS